MAEEKQSESDAVAGVVQGTTDAPAPSGAKDHKGASTPPANNGNTIDKAKTSEVKGSGGGGIEPKGQSDYNHFVHAPLSPSFAHHYNGQPYYYQPTPNSPATPNLMNGYDVQSLLNQQQMRQQYPAIPPLSPGGDANNGVHEEVNLSMGTVPPASPLFPGTAMPIFGSGIGSAEQIDSSRSIIPPSSPGLQYLSGPPPSPVISYGGMYSSSLTPGSPEPHASWSDR